MALRWRFTIDANILVYAVNIDAGWRHEIAVAILRMARDADCVLTLQVLGEFYRVTARKGMLDHAAAVSFIREWCNAFVIVAAKGNLIFKAVEAVKNHSLSYWDSMLCTTALEAGCSAVITEDMNHGQSIDGLDIISPYASGAETLLVSYFKGDLPTQGMQKH